VTVEAVADAGQIRTLVLPDSSVVTLNAGSQLTYKANMQHDSYREVWLDGEAFFDVKHLWKKNLPQRFIVHTGDMDIEVIGTTFNVKKVGGYTNVSLNTGRIRIGLKDEPNSTIELLPGDFVRYSSREKHIVKKQVKPELFTVWKEEKLSLDNMTVTEIARLLEDAYGYTVNIQDNQLAETKLSGTLQLKDESTLLEALAFTLDIDIIKKDSVLYLQLKNKQ
jgi:ferric-dicitrate binding protein FerR (iron transport regulator)